MSDQTMRNLLEVHREEIQQRDELIESLTRDRHLTQYQIDESARKLRTAEGMQEYYRKLVDDRDAKVEKLNGVVESLRIELADARAAATIDRDMAVEVAKHCGYTGEGYDCLCGAECASRGDWGTHFIDAVNSANQARESAHAARAE